MVDPRRPFAPSSFTRLARAHAASAGGDALFVIALAGSVFFSLDFDAARWRVALYLALTVAPFAVAAPFIGPALDRIPGGRRWVVIGSMALRAIFAVLVIRHLDAIWFYPEAFLMLVLAKAYSISKSALVPTTVRSDAELVRANSRLTVLSGIAVAVVFPFGGLLLRFGGSGWVLGLSAVLFTVGIVLAFQLPPVRVASQPEGEMERAELRSAGIVLATSAIGSMRAIVGFLTFMLAFAFKDDDASLWYLGVAAVCAQAGVFVGAMIAPFLRRMAREQTIMAGCLISVVLGGVAGALVGGLAAAGFLALLVGAASNAAKQAFDALVQRDAPDANRGRSFAKFETRFQLFWVIGALIPIVVPIPMTWGFLAIALLAAVSATSYLVGQSQVRKGKVPQRRIQLSRRPWVGLLRRRENIPPSQEDPSGLP